MSFLVGAGLGVLSDELELTVTSLTTAVSATLLEKPELVEEWVKKIDLQVKKNGKFIKSKVAYIPLAPPPVFWDYSCGNCRVYNTHKKTCQWVDEWGLPQPGIIHAQAWCAVWIPPKGQKPFTWFGKPPPILEKGNEPVIP